MENNIIKENQLEVLPKSEINNIIVVNELPVLSKCRSDLLPIVISQKALALLEIKEEYYKVKKLRHIYGIVWFLKNVLVLFGKLVRYIFLASTRIISFALFSAVVILSTTIITSNVVNMIYGIKDTSQNNTEYSIYNVKDDAQARANAEAKEQNLKANNTKEQMNSEQIENNLEKENK